MAAETNQLQGNKREQALVALKTLDSLLNEFNLLVSKVVRDEVESLLNLFSDGHPKDDLLDQNFNETREDMLLRLLDYQSYEGRLIRELSKEAGINAGFFTELYIDVFESRQKALGISTLRSGQIEVDSLKGENITDVFLYGDYDEFIVFTNNLKNDGVNEVYIKVDWDTLKDAPEVPYILKRLKAFRGSFTFKNTICAIECTATQYYHEILNIEGSANVFASGVNWIRKPAN